MRKEKYLENVYANNIYKISRRVIYMNTWPSYLTKKSVLTT